MPKVVATRRTRHAASDMLELVADVERYPEFVPLCERLKLQSKTREGAKDVLVSEMSVGYRAIRETFATQVTVDRPAMVIDFTYLTGPFRRLSGHWWFEAKGPRETLVHFNVDYEFRSRLLALLMGSMFDYAFRRFADAFEKRADRIYGVAA